MLKTILVHVNQSIHAPARMRYAASLARATGAHLVGAAMLGVSRSIFPNGYEVRPGTLSASCFQPLALGASVPLLRRAAGVTLVALAGPEAAGEEFEAEQSDLKHYLKRHHVTPHLLVRAARHDTGRELLALGEELGCGMLVMGCYGHGRFRELCIGGASRTVLADAAIPVLLAH